MRDRATVKRSRLALYTLFAANAISMVGNQITLLAVPWFVLQTTGSAAKTGITGFFTILPIVLAAFFGGAIVDRLGYKRTSIIADLASGFTVALIPLLYNADLLPFWSLLVLVFCGALLDAPGATAREALIPDLAPAADMPLERAGSLLQVVERGSRLVGAPLGGLLIAVIGTQNVLWIDAATFGVSALLIAVGVPFAKAAARTEGKSYLAELTVGLRFLRTNPLMRVLVLILVVTNFLDAAKASVILPVFASETYGTATALGLMFGLSGGGAVLGALLYAWIGHRFSRRWVFTWAFIIVSMPSFVLALFPPLWVVLVLQLIHGMAAGPINPILSTIGYERIPADMRGRVFGTITAGAYVAMPLGVLLSGYMLEWTTLRIALLATGGCYLLATSGLLFMQSLRGMDDRFVAAQPAEVIAT